MRAGSVCIIINTVVKVHLEEASLWSSCDAVCVCPLMLAPLKNQFEIPKIKRTLNLAQSKHIKSNGRVDHQKQTKQFQQTKST